MNKTLLILKREYLTRVKKKSFIILTMLVPFLMVGMFALIIYLSVSEDKEDRTIAVYDESSMFLGEFADDGNTKYEFIPQETYLKLKEDIHKSSYYAILFIPGNIYTNNFARLESTKQIPFELSDKIERKLSRFIENDKRQKVIAETNIPNLDQKLNATKTRIKLTTLKISDKGEEKKSSSKIAFITSYAMGFIIYFFVFMYGAMVMRSVMDEKKSRIVEVIVSSVKPFQLMVGKIVGTALVGLTQVAIWVVMGVILMGVAQAFFTPESAQQMGQSIMETQQMGANPVAAQMSDQNKVTEVLNMISSMNIPLILFSFIAYFLIGYLLYSSLLGAVGAAVDNEEDSQQMVFPVTIPLILSIMLLFPIAKNPEGPVAFWFSMFPLTSPVSMMARIPYDIPTWEIIVSLLILIGTTVGAMWAAAKIYKTGILMYGKKVNLKELYKWLRYKS